MAVLNQASVYHFAEKFEVQSQGITAIDLMSFQDGEIIEGVIVHIKTPATGACNLIVGDDDDPDGFIAAADGSAAADTIYGDGVTERGAYLYDSTSKAGHYKVYQTITKKLKFVLSAAPTTQGVYNVIVFGHRSGI
jgi:hypothetical protein